MTLSNIKKFKEERGFTIVELLIVIVIIAILAAIVIVAYNGITNRAKASKALSAAQAVQQKAEAYNAELGYYPDAGADLTGATSDKSYNLTGVTFASSDITAAPTDENTVYMTTCPASSTASAVKGVQIKYWDYGASPAAAKTITAGVCP
ncbi:MAG TPA: prepilin-type N-terminal cleavage/methylation domain-containing protein [Candidatus Saccharimonadales bacterium]|nr:prepilin-type N-terminal cleavage/methylation domain-containing protein [Candidatus Saccharimonadales bacterium]